jgi:hypothetical protein
MSQTNTKADDEFLAIAARVGREEGRLLRRDLASIGAVFDEKMPQGRISNFMHFKTFKAMVEKIRELTTAFKDSDEDIGSCDSAQYAPVFELQKCFREAIGFADSFAAIQKNERTRVAELNEGIAPIVVKEAAAEKVKAAEILKLADEVKSQYRVFAEALAKKRARNVYKVSL